MIDGPAKQPELVQLFETEHNNNAKDIAAHYSVAYFSSTEGGSETSLTNFLQAEKTAILEIFTDKELNASHFAYLKSLFTHNGK